MILQKSLHDFAVDIGQSVLASLIAEGESGVVDTGEVHDGGLHVMHMNRIFGDIPCEVIRFAIDGAGFAAATCKPPCEGAAEVIAAFGIGGVTLTEGCASKFAGPDNERVIEHAAFFEVVNEGSGWLFGITALFSELRMEVSVLIPAGMHELNEANATFEESSGDKAVIGEGAFDESIGAVAFDDGFGFAGEVDEFGDAALHAEGHFVLGNPCFSFGVTVVLEVSAVDCGDVIEEESAGFGRDSGGVAEVGDRVACVAEAHALEAAGKKAGAPVVVEEELSAGFAFVAGGHDDEGGEVFGFAAESVGEPCAHAGASGDL